MNSRRQSKASQAILETVSTCILFELRDPRIQNVTVLRVEVSGDLCNAKVYVSVMGDAKDQSLCLHGLTSARGYLQSKVADRLQTKNTPILKFVLDQSVKKSIEASRILNDVLPEEAPPPENSDAAVESAPETDSASETDSVPETDFAPKTLPESP